VSVDPALAAGRRAALQHFARLAAMPAMPESEIRHPLATPPPLEGIGASADRETPRPYGAPDAAAPRDAAPARATRAELRRLAHALEGVFLNQLFQAMRQSVPRGQGPLAPGSGEEMFTSLMDESLSRQAAERMSRGVGEALYRQLARGLPPEEGTSR
jgi:hypothetical protein